MGAARVPSVRFELPREPNPVLVKELRARFRGPRAFAALTSFLILLTFFAWFFYSQMARGLSQMPPSYFASQSAEIGKSILVTVAVIEALFIAIVGPSLTADCISGEMERQTWDLLRATPLSGWSILLGKVGAAFGYIVLLVLSALPVMSLAFIFGGASLSGVLWLQASMLTAGAMYLAIGAFWSGFVRRTGRAAIMSYLTVGVLLLAPIGIPMLFEMLTAFQGNWDHFNTGRYWSFTLAVSPPVEAMVQNQFPVQWNDVLPALVAAMVLRLLVAAGLILLTGRRIRGWDWRGQAGLLFVLAMLMIWFAVTGSLHTIQP